MMSFLLSTLGANRSERPLGFLPQLLLALFVAGLMALPTAAGLPTGSAPAPRSTSFGVRSTGLSANADLLSRAGDSAQAISAAQASLARAWGVSPTLDPAGCLTGSGTCSLALPSGGSPISAPLPGAAKPRNYPPLVTGASVVYDANPMDGFVVVYGGLQPNGLPSGQTWIYGGGSWANITPGPKKPQPGPRWDAMMAYDAADGYVVLFGGCTNLAIEGICVRSAGDTWKFLTGSWALLVPPAPPRPPPNFPPTPSARWDGAMTYDSELRAVVLFGGASGLTDTPPPPGSCQPLVPTIDSDTWKLTRGTTTSSWSEIGTGTSPPAGYGGRMADDPAAGVTILFGGTNFYRTDHTCTPPTELASTVTGNDSVGTWALSSTGSWSKLTLPVSPPPRRDANMAVGAGNQIYLQGGTNDTGGIFTDVWSLGGAVLSWNNLLGGAAPPTQNGPAPRYDAGFGWDSFDGVFLMVGGQTAAGAIIGDAWAFNPPLQWGLEAPAAGFPAAPSSRYQEAMAFDDNLNGVVMFGGEVCGASSCRFLGDTWLFTSGAWQLLSLPLAPSARFGASMSYNPWTNTLILFGGCGAVCPLGDTWQLAKPARGGSPVWTQLFPSVAPPARYFAAMSFVAMDPELLLFGGCEGARGPCPAGDTWVYISANWRLVPPTPGSTPPARFGASMAPFTRNPSASTARLGGVIMFGGQGPTGMLGDTWNFTNGAWSEIRSSLTPPARVFATLAYDPLLKSLILFGGCGWTQCPTFNAWTYSLGGQSRPAPPPAPPPPPWPWAPAYNVTQPDAPILSGPIYGAAGVWDPVDGPVGFVLFVGGRMPNGSTLMATDVFAGDGWMDLTRYV